MSPDNPPISLDRLVTKVAARLMAAIAATSVQVSTYLKSLPVDVLKIDRSFVADLGTNPDELAIVRAIIALAESFGLHLVVEGVETEGPAMTLLVNGCHRAQGFLLAGPLAGEDMAALPAAGRVPVHFSGSRAV
jgi:EAL domain-containing protein (putative c-di-GMP-specific phosphodiesterase class I)